MKADKSPLSIAAIKSMPTPAPGKRSVLHDAKIPGLQVRKTSSGHVSFSVVKKFADKPVRVYVGDFPNMTLKQARDQAQKLLAEFADKKNPNTAARKAKQAKITLRECAEAYIQSRPIKPTTQTDIRRALHQVFADHLDQPLAKLTAETVLKRLREHGEQHSKARANCAMRWLKAISKFSRRTYLDEQGEPLIPGDPMRLIVPGVLYRIERKKSHIPLNGMKDWWNAVEALPDASRDLLQFMILTGARCNEASSLTWTAIDTRARTVTFAQTKSGKAHTLPLSDYLTTMLERRREQGPGPYVFADAAGRKVPNLRNHIKQAGEQANHPFTAHDFRRSFATIADSLEISAFALRRLMNHSEQADVTAGYLVVDTERLRGPMQRITDTIINAAQGNSGNVIELRRSA